MWEQEAEKMYLKNEHLEKVISFCQKQQEKTSFVFTMKKWNELSKNTFFLFQSKLENLDNNYNYKQMAEVLMVLGEFYDDIGMIFAMNNHLWACKNVIAKFGSEDLKEKYLWKLGNGNCIGGFALTEPNSGSDAFSLRTKYQKGDHIYLLNGRKRFISNAPIADVMIVIAKEDSKQGMQSLNAFVVDMNQQGISVDKIEKAGLQSCPFGDIVLENYEISEKNMIGKKGSGAIIVNYALEMERCFEFASYIGSLKKMLKIVLDIGRIIKLEQEERFFIGELATVIDIAEQYLYFLADMKDQDKLIYKNASMFKLFVSENYLKYSRIALDICYKYRDTRSEIVENEYMSAVASTIYSGTSAIQKNIICENLLWR